MWIVRGGKIETRQAKDSGFALGLAAFLALGFL